MIRPQSPLLKLWVGNWVYLLHKVFTTRQRLLLSAISLSTVIGNCLLYLHSDKAQNDMTSWAAHSLKRDCRSN